MNGERRDREVYRFEHVAGYTLAILRSFIDAPAAAVVACDPDGDGDVGMLPPHEVPKAARALYEAAGLPVPALPDIPDPALVAALANDIHYVMTGTVGCNITSENYARAFLARGWGRTA